VRGELTAMAKVKIVYYLDVLSSWCLIADDAVERIRREFGAEVEVDWRIASLRDPFGYSKEQLAWYYRRTEAVTGVRLDPVWLDGRSDGSHFANLAAEAARMLGCKDDRVRLAIARGAMLDGKPCARRDVVVEVAAEAGSIDRSALERQMDDPITAMTIRKSTEAFDALHVEVRPTFVLSNGIGDSSVLSGCWRHGILSGCVRALLDDDGGYEKFVAAHPPPAGTR
jgi:predicted DsbA family dithiol-disulfide isomerase